MPDPRGGERINRAVQAVCFVVFAVGVLTNTGPVGWLSWPSALVQATLAGVSAILVLLRNAIARVLALVAALGLSLFGAGNMPGYLRLVEASESTPQQKIGAGLLVIALNFAFFSLAIEHAAPSWRRHLGRRGQ